MPILHVVNVFCFTNFDPFIIYNFCTFLYRNDGLKKKSRFVKKWRKLDWAQELMTSGRYKVVLLQIIFIYALHWFKIEGFFCNKI